jgi:hypothetical protein
VPRISINNLPSLKLFSLLNPHSKAYYQIRHCHDPLLTKEAVDSTRDLFGGSNQGLVSLTTGYDSEETDQLASVMGRSADWIDSLMGQMHPGLDVVSDRTFEIDVPSALFNFSRAGKNSRLLLQIIHSAANNLLSASRASEVLSVVLENNNRKIFQALIA